jgi:plastocyanin
MIKRLALVIACIALVLTACGDDDTGGPRSVEITGVDYAFEDVPDTLAAGSTLTFKNDSTQEVHEMIVVRLDDAETRPMEELVTLPEDEIEPLITDVGVSVALPGEDGIVVEGSDPITVDEPGRYAIVCFIPFNSDVEVAREVLSGPPPEGDGPPPSLGEGPPHVTGGMFAEFTVEE